MNKENIDFAEKNLNRLLEWVNRFDNKSTIILGIDTGMLGVVATTAPPISSWNSLITVPALFAIGSLAVSLLFVYKSIYPRTEGPKDSLIYFGSIADKSLEEYKEALCNQSQQAYLNDLLEQCHRNSEILHKKFACLKKAYQSLLIGVLPWALTIYLFKSIP